MAGPLQLGVIHTCRQEPVQQALTEKSSLYEFLIFLETFQRIFSYQFVYQLQEFN
jgi:hypothetical protein